MDLGAVALLVAVAEEAVSGVVVRAADTGLAAAQEVGEGQVAGEALQEVKAVPAAAEAVAGPEARVGAVAVAVAVGREAARVEEELPGPAIAEELTQVNLALIPPATTPSLPP